jgi:hypothetical protein
MFGLSPFPIPHLAWYSKLYDTFQDFALDDLDLDGLPEEDRGVLLPFRPQIAEVALTRSLQSVATVETELTRSGWKISKKGRKNGGLILATSPKSLPKPSDEEKESA